MMIDIIIPTWNNPTQIGPCVTSIHNTGILKEGSRILIVNNGSQPLKEQCEGVEGIEVLGEGENLGWEGGLELGLKHSDSKYVVFQNDDTVVPRASRDMYRKMMRSFSDERVAAVGPVTTCASGPQSMFAGNTPQEKAIVTYLIYFCVMIRRSVVDKFGIDRELPGGDDIDMSIQINKEGMLSLIDPECFIFHHGFQTGTRVHGDGYAGVAGGWNSPQMIERTQGALVRKHGFRNYFRAVSGQPQPYEVQNEPA